MKAQRLFAALTATVACIIAVNPVVVKATTVHTPPWADVFSGPMWAGVDPRGDADTAVAALKAMGYTAFDDNNDTSAPQSIGIGLAQDDAVWVAYGHAMPGQITIENGATGNPPSAAIGAVVRRGWKRDHGVGPGQLVRRGLAEDQLHARSARSGADDHRRRGCDHAIDTVRDLV
jgi:hypothetical protein